jgi:hypothetical protein
VHVRIVWVVLCAIGAAAVSAAPEPAPAPRPVLEREWSDPPAAVAALLNQVRKGTPDERADAVEALVKAPGAEPYLRHAILVDSDRRLHAAYTDVLAGIDERNAERIKKWSKEGRIDLLVEVACFAQSDDTIDEVMKHLFEFAAGCQKRAVKHAGVPSGAFKSLGPAESFPDFIKYEKPLRNARERVNVSNDFSGRPLLIRTEHISAESGLSRTVAVVRDGWSAKALRTNKLHTSLLFANGDVALGDVHRCLIVVDGDVTQWQEGEYPAEANYSVVIARGSVLGPARFSSDSHTGCVWAGGDITFRSPAKGLARWALFARGELKAEVEKGHEPAVAQSKTKENPFGVRFFETGELGVEVEAHADGVRIRALAPDSPLAQAGLRVGDVIGRINDTRTDSVKEFRRELRRAVVWEAGVFWLRNDDQRPTRVVRLADVLK